MRVVRAVSDASRALCLAAGIGGCIGALPALAARPPQEARGRECYQHDPALGWSKRPGSRARHATPEFDVELAVNSRGLRGPERGYETPPGVTRVLLIGDSFVEGFGVAEQEGIASRLEARLQPRRVEVLNGGTRGYSTDQQLLFYRNEGKRYEPGVVLLFVFFNDVVANQKGTASRRDKPFFVEEGSALVLRNVPVPKLTPSLWEETGADAADWVRARLGPRPEELAVYESRQAPFAEGAWRLTERLISDLAGEVTAGGGRLALVYVPHKAEVHDEAWAKLCRRFRWNADTADRRAVAARFLAIAARLELPALDLTAAMRAAAARADPYYGFDPHWNARGHAVATDATTEFLLSLDWLAERPRGR